MALDKNPTKTRTIEKAWQRDINRRWSSFTKSIMTRLNQLNDQALLVNAEKAFALDASQIRIYMEFLNNQIDSILLGTAEPPNWQARYQLESYIRGLSRSEASLLAQGADITPSGAEVVKAQLLQAGQFTAIPALATSGVLAPIHQDAFEFLFTRSYESLAKWTKSMSTEVRQIMMDALQQGQGIVKTRNKIRERIGVSKSRAELIARTETNAAFNEASISETERAAEQLGEEILIRWISALSPTTRHLHGGVWHGDLITPKEARRRKQAPHIYNCKCSSSPAIPEAQTAKINKRFREQREEFIKREALIGGGKN